MRSSIAGKEGPLHAAHKMNIAACRQLPVEITLGSLTRTARGMSARQRQATTTIGVYHMAKRLTYVSVGDCREVAWAHSRKRYVTPDRLGLWAVKKADSSMSVYCSFFYSDVLKTDFLLSACAEITAGVVYPDNVERLSFCKTVL